MNEQKNLNQIPGCYSAGAESGAGEAKQTLQQVILY